MNTPGKQVAYLMARLPIALSFIGHGLIRLPKLQSFAGGMAASFTNSPLPRWLVLPFGYVLPFLELLAGLLLWIGWKTREAILLGWLIMLALIFGSSMVEQWQNVFTQILYGAYFAGLYAFLDYNSYSIDGKLGR